jgi:predicted phage baseplate assembly protein
MRGEINTLRSSIPYVDRVFNRSAAHGGMDAESLDSAMVKASNLIRTRERAITADDFEFVANRVLQTRISRVKCIQPRPDDAEIAEIGNRVYVVVIARVDAPGRRLSSTDLTVSDADIAELKRRFEDHRPLTMHVDVSSPAFMFVAVRIVLKPAFDADYNEIERQVLARLYRFVNPIVGWTDGRGWPFGRKIRVLDIPNIWQDIPGVHFVQSVELYETDANGERSGEPVDEVSVVRNGVICSGRHTVDFLRSDAKESGNDGAAV